MRKKPPRFVKKRNSFYHVGYKQLLEKMDDGSFLKTIQRPYTPLGNDYNKAILRWAQVEAEQSVVTDTFAALSVKYKKEVLPLKKENTQDAQILQLKLLVKVFGDMALSSIKPHHIGEYLDKREAKISANREVQLMSAMFTKAIRWGWIEFNPTLGVQKNPEKVRDRYITDEEFTLIRINAGIELRCIVDIAYATGLRISDIRNIRRSKPVSEIREARKAKLNIAFTYIQENILYVEQIKTGTKQIFHIEGFLLTAITTALEIERKVKSQYLFCTRKGEAHSKSGFDSKWRRFKQRINLDDIHFHDIRAKTGTDAKLMGKNHQALLGHSDISQSEKYVKSRMIEEIEPLDFNEKRAFKKR